MKYQKERRFALKRAILYAKRAAVVWFCGAIIIIYALPIALAGLLVLIRLAARKATPNDNPENTGRVIRTVFTKRHKKRAA